MKNSLRQAYWNWFLLSAFFAYQYMLRTYPGVLIDDVRVSFQMSAQEFAKLSAYYLYIYSVLQIPIGVVLDRIGIRIVVLFSIVLCLFGNYLLLRTHSPLCAQLSRILVGAGSACALISSMKVASDNFSERKKGFLIGLTFAIGDMAVILGSIWLVKLAQQMGWRYAVNGLQYLGYVFFIFCFFKLREPVLTQEAVVEKDEEAEGSILHYLRHIIFHPRIFLYGVLSIGVYSPIAAVSDLWGTGFLMTKFGLTQLQATKINMIIFLGFAIGGVLVPLFFGYGKSVLRGVRYSGVVMAILFAILMYASSISLWSLRNIMFFLGFFSCAEILCFVLATQLAKPNTSGLIAGWVNTFNMIGGAIIQQAVGWYLDYRWGGSMSSEGIKLYQAQEYVNAFLLLLLVIVGCTIVTFFMRSHRHSVKKFENLA